MRVYHDLFFDVRPRLGDPSFLSHILLPWWPQPGDADYIGALRLFGYILGGRAVDGLLHYIISSRDSGVCTDGASAMESERARWERLLEQAWRTSKALAQHEGNERQLALVTLLRKEGAPLVAEGVEVPVPPPPKEPPVQPMGERAWMESTRSRVDKHYMGPLLVEDEDGVIRLC